MELVDGGALDRYLEKKGAKLSVKARVNILIEAATGLEYLHTKGMSSFYISLIHYIFL